MKIGITATDMLHAATPATTLLNLTGKDLSLYFAATPLEIINSSTTELAGRAGELHQERIFWIVADDTVEGQQMAHFLNGLNLTAYYLIGGVASLKNADTTCHA